MSPPLSYPPKGGGAGISNASFFVCPLPKVQMPPITWERDVDGFPVPTDYDDYMPGKDLVFARPLHSLAFFGGLWHEV